MTSSSLPAALRACAEGLCAIEAATGLISAHGTWLARADFACFTYCGAGTAAIESSRPFLMVPAGASSRKLRR